MSGSTPMSVPGYTAPPCKATSKATGKPCGRTAVPGATVCRYHGGAAPQVQKKAALRLLELVDPAIATLARTMADPAAPHAARIRAAENVLDRAGVPRRVEATEADIAKAVLLERLLAMRDQTPPAPEHDTVPGEVVPDPDPDTTPEENP